MDKNWHPQKGQLTTTFFVPMVYQILGSFSLCFSHMHITFNWSRLLCVCAAPQAVLDPRATLPSHVMRSITRPQAQRPGCIGWAQSSTVDHTWCGDNHIGSIWCDFAYKTWRALPYPARMPFSRSIAWIRKKVITLFEDSPLSNFC